MPTVELPRRGLPGTAERTPAVVTHGGHGTVIKALAAGVPLVIALVIDELELAAARGRPAAPAGEHAPIGCRHG